MAEPTITINGIRLTESEAMAVRIAVTSYRDEMKSLAVLGDDQHDRAMAKGLHARLSDVLNLMSEVGPRG